MDQFAILAHTKDGDYAVSEWAICDHRQAAEIYAERMRNKGYAYVVIRPCGPMVTAYLGGAS